MAKKATAAAKTAPKNTAPASRMPLTWYNYKLMLIGLAAVVLGFILMAGGKSSDPNVFNYDMFSFRRITLAPILVVAGLAFEFYAIMAREKTPEQKEARRKEKQDQPSVTADARYKK